jgi:hypothetical protein
MYLKYSAIFVVFISIICSNLIYASSECPVDSKFENYTCYGVFTTSSMIDLLNDKQTLGYKNKKIKSLLVNLDLNSASDLSLSSNCSIKISEIKYINISGKFL